MDFVATSNRSTFPSTELCFRGNKYTTSDELRKKPIVQLKYMGKAYKPSMGNASRGITNFKYRGVSYSK